MTDTSDAILLVRSRRVFVGRLWVGMAILRLGFWVMGARAQSPEPYQG